ncbi:MAG: type II toxin-antitoxin system VapC family toxin [Akkermansiaceae bacterium]|nr:type II toxin-antitoxin system VapC family toxin [Akkermansiaceae bacterium]
MTIFEGRILGVGLEEAEVWGRLNAVKKLPEVDGLITATAIVHGLTVVTRNVKDFESSGVKIINPWEFVG